MDTLPKIQIATPKELWDWLDKNHDSEESFLLVSFKKIRPDSYVSRSDILDALIAYGWFDGRRFVGDEERTQQLICRRKQHKWTASYRDRYEKLAAEGRLKPAGIAMAEYAHAQNSWHADEDVDSLVDPDDLRHRLVSVFGYEYWASAAPSYRRNVLRWLASAKKPETRRDRIEKIAAACAQSARLKHF